MRGEEEHTKWWPRWSEARGKQDHAGYGSRSTSHRNVTKDQGVKVVRHSSGITTSNQIFEHAYFEFVFHLATDTKATSLGDDAKEIRFNGIQLAFLNTENSFEHIKMFVF